MNTEAAQAMAPAAKPAELIPREDPIRFIGFLFNQARVAFYKEDSGITGNCCNIGPASGHVGLSSAILLARTWFSFLSPLHWPLNIHPINA